MEETPHAVFTTAMQVRPDDIDMHRHVHNSRYLDYVLAARFDQMARCYGISMEDFNARGFTWFVRTAHIEHRGALRLGDTFRVRTSVAEIRSRGVRVVFSIERTADDAVAADGYCTYALINLATGRPARIPEDFRAAYTV